MGPTALPGGLACLFYLKSCRSGLPAGFGPGTKKPPTFLSGVLGLFGLDGGLLFRPVVYYPLSPNNPANIFQTLHNS